MISVLTGNSLKKGGCMKKRVLAFILAVCISVPLFPMSAYADDATLGGTGITVFPISDTEVEMEEEIIDIVVRDGCSYVTCQFFFHNTGDGTNLLVGFPTQYPGGYESQEELDEEMEGEYFDEMYVTQLNWFRTFVDGERVHVTVKKGLEPEGNNADDLYFPQWYTWRMHFAADERIKVVNKYWMENSFGGECTEWISYILRSGATWKGPIGKITVRMQLEDYNLSATSFPGMQPTYIEENGNIVWEAENIEPEEDVDVWTVDTPYSQFGGNPYDEYNDEEASEFETYRKMDIRMMRNFYAGHFNGVTWWGDKFFDRFDKQSSQLYYCMGVSYYKLGYNDSALNMFSYIQDETDMYYLLSAYYKALICQEAGDGEGYEAYVDMLAQYTYPVEPNETSGANWIEVWVQSRLDDLQSYK